MMERDLKIYPQGLPPHSASAGPWHWSLLIQHALDPLLAVAIYFGVLATSRRPVTESDLAVLALMLFVLVPTDIPFRTFNSRVALTVIGAWLRVSLAIAALWIVVENLSHRLVLNEEITVTWLVLTPAAMLLLHWAVPPLMPRLWALYPQKKAVVVGVNGVALRVAESIAQREREGLHFAGYFDDRDAARLTGVGPLPVLGRLADVSGFVKANRIDAIYISLPMAAQPRVVSLLQSLADTTASIHFLPDIFVADPIQGRVTMVAGLPVLSVCETPFDGPAGAIKRTFDLTLTIAAIPLVVPLAVVISLLIRVSSPGPAIFKQRRYGLDGKQIVVFKFRTMTTLEDGERTYTQVTRDDTRVTRIGRFLRRTSLDELPQLYNVLCGSMSLIGPRPHALAVNEQYRKLIPRYMVRHKVKPGITGWAQVNGCRGGDDLDTMRRRTEYDLAYLRSWSLGLDILIVMKTIKVLVVGDDSAY
jgi:putative colanic acid biosynthesis UDP-glucose lipid carrier transferase